MTDVEFLVYAGKLPSATVWAFSFSSGPGGLLYVHGR